MPETNYAQLSPGELVRALAAAGESPDGALLARIREVGAPCVPLLVQALEDPDPPEDGWAPEHAARLLGEMKATEAVEPLLRAMAGVDSMTILLDNIMFALPEMGAALVEPALKAHARSDDGDHRDMLCAALARCGTRDDRTWDLLVEQLARSPALGAMNMAYYGDDRALPLLVECLDALQPDGTGRLDSFGVIEVCATIQDLGGTLTDVQREKQESAVLQRRRQFLPDDAFAALEQAARAGEKDAPRGLPSRSQEPNVRDSAKVGRNDPCPCGSGKKYKKCHGAG